LIIPELNVAILPLTANYSERIHAR
jgi:hypothetical protein